MTQNSVELSIRGATKQVSVVEYNGEPVVTLRMVDELHGRPDGTAGRNFRQHRGRLIEGTDFWELSHPDEIRRVVVGNQGGVPESVILLSQSGYLMLVKSLRDDLAWEVQRQLVNCYFRAKSVATPSEERVMRAIGSEIALGIREGLRDGLKPVNDRIDKVVDRLDSIERSVVRRKDLTAYTKRQHINTMLFLGGRCPCCSRVDVIDDYGNKLVSANWEHWYAPHRNATHETWLVCSECNQAMRDPKFRSQMQRFFDAYQMRVGEQSRPLLAFMAHEPGQ